MEIIIGLIVFAGVVITIVAYAKSVDSAEDARHIREMERLKNKKEREENYAKALSELELKYGKTTIKISLPEGAGGGYYSTRISSHLFFFEDASIVVINEEPISFKKILAYTLADNKETIAKTIGNEDTHTSTGSMASRALIGGALLGGVGALAGAATAKKKTEINTVTHHKTSHDYILYLSIDDLANPQRVIKFRSDADSANKAASVFDIIINRNNQ